MYSNKILIGNYFFHVRIYPGFIEFVSAITMSCFCVLFGVIEVFFSFSSTFLDHEQLLCPGDFGSDQELLRDFLRGDTLRDLARVTRTADSVLFWLPCRLRCFDCSCNLLLSLYTFECNFERLRLWLRHRDLDLDLDLKLRI
jgi:hypothetical protein